MNKIILVLLLNLSVVYAQSAWQKWEAFNSGNVINPMQYASSAFAFYDSKDAGTITKDGSNYVSRWNDKYGKGRDLIQLTASAQPQQQANGEILFDGTSDFLKTAASTLNQPVTIIACLKQVTWTSSDAIWDGAGLANGLIYQRISSPNIAITAGSVLGNNSDMTLNQFKLLTVVLNSSNTIVRVNNGTPLKGNAGTVNMGGFTLGSIGAANDRYGNISVEGIFIYPGILTDYEIEGIKNWMYSYYGVQP